MRKTENRLLNSLILHRLQNIGEINLLIEVLSTRSRTVHQVNRILIQMASRADDEVNPEQLIIISLELGLIKKKDNNLDGLFFLRTSF